MTSLVVAMATSGGASASDVAGRLLKAMHDNEKPQRRTYISDLAIEATGGAPSDCPLCIVGE